MTVIIKPIDSEKETLFEKYHYREFEDVESIDDGGFPLIKIRHKSHDCYVLMQVPDDCYLLVLLEDE